MSDETTEPESARFARRARLERYLLGTLEEDERAVVRAEAIADPEVLAELEEIEIDLLDDAARGRLTAEDRERVETRLARAEGREGAWTLAQALAARGAARPTPVRASWTRAAVWPIAATLVVAAGISLLVWRTSGPGASAPPVASLPGGPSTGPGPSPGPGPVPGAPPGAPSVASNPVTAPPVTPDQPRQPGADATPGLLARDATVATLYLPAAVLRGARPEVRLGPQATTLRLEIEIAPPAPARVDIALRAVPGGSLRSLTGVRVIRKDGQQLAIVSTAAAGLPPGPYEATITIPRTQTPARLIPFLLLRD